MDVLINGVRYRPETIADELPDNWQELVTKRIIKSKKGHTIITDDLIAVWSRATGRTLLREAEPCVNDLRRFFLCCLTSLEVNIDET